MMLGGNIESAFSGDVGSTAPSLLLDSVDSSFASICFCVDSSVDDDFSLSKKPSLDSGVDVWESFSGSGGDAGGSSNGSGVGPWPSSLL